MITKKEVVRLMHYNNHVFNRDTKQLYRCSFGTYREVIPVDGVYAIKLKGETHKFTEYELMRATDYISRVNLKISKHFVKRNRSIVW